ncbi:MAG: 4-(cytidine 5'-diphospho)-2-C-methyl-D-erythritol kinase [Deltaproteobacteria bacterium]|nr:MAG: 4-(cytidine 5'-diphospho)-2-C-methyl-D-erythritol kinase [Deltaproteobacteria bacterium]
MMKIYAPAKINLFLHVAGKRKDGYHNLVTLMCCIGLHDTVTLEFGVPETVITCRDAKIPKDKTNLAYRAAECFFTQLWMHHKMRPDHVAIHIDKRIPAAAGLGGGSSNAAAVVLGLNCYYGQPFSKTQLLTMGQSIGADVPFFIFRHPAIATGIGERLEIYSGLQPYHILLVHPGFEVSTAEVYKNLDLGLTNCKKKLKKEVLQNNTFKPTNHLCNDLETVTVKRYPEIALVKDALIRHGATGALMSGSGPTVFGLFSDIRQAQNAREALKQHRNWRFFLTNIIFEDRVMIT